MKSLFQFYRSSIGKKIVVALTGVGLLLYVLVHMLGNLQIFVGQDAINAYAKALKSLGPGLWIVRIGLLVLFVVHIVATIQLRRQNWVARGTERYAQPRTERATLASRTMIISGLIVLCFVIYHIMHFTLGVGSDYLSYKDAQGRHDVYRMLVEGFSHWLVSGFYIFSMALLCWHLSHGFSSVFQTLGLRTQRTWPLIVTAGHLYAWIIFLGNSSIPIAVLMGFVTLD